MSQPWWINVPNPQQRDRYRVQVATMIRAMNADPHHRDRGIEVVPHPDSGDLADAAFLYARSRLLVRDADLPAVLERLRVLGTGPYPTTPLGQTHLSVVQLPTAMSTGAALEYVAGELGPGKATLDRVVHLTTSSACPATEPLPVTDLAIVPAALAPVGPTRRPRVAVVDTGISTNPGGVMVDLGAWDWMRPERIAPHPEDTDQAGSYRGHGLFVTGIIAALAPDADITSYAFFGVSGGRIESDLVTDLLTALRATPAPDVISMSAGVSLPGAAPVPDPAATTSLAFEAFRAELAATGTVLVSAAGNDACSGPFEPASLPWSTEYAVAVGALDDTGSQIAGYSNYGPWVDVYARGSQVVNAFVNGAYRYVEPPLQGQPLVISNKRAAWSGTSFATPTVAAIIAHRMAAKGITDARTAWRQLLDIARRNAPTAGGLPSLRPEDSIR